MPQSGGYGRLYTAGNKKRKTQASLRCRKNSFSDVSSPSANIHATGGLRRFVRRSHALLLTLVSRLSHNGHCAKYSRPPPPARALRKLVPVAASFSAGVFVK